MGPVFRKFLEIHVTQVSQVSDESNFTDLDRRILVSRLESTLDQPVNHNIRQISKQGLMLGVSGSKIDIAVFSKGNARAEPKIIKQVNCLLNNAGSSRNASRSKKVSTTSVKLKQKKITGTKTITVREKALALLESKTGSGNGQVSIKFNHYNKKFPIFNGVLTWKDIDSEYAFSFVYKGKYFRRIMDLTTGMTIQSDDDCDYFVNLVDGQTLLVQVEEGEEGIGAEGIRLQEGPLKLASNDQDVRIIRANK